MTPSSKRKLPHPRQQQGSVFPLHPKESQVLVRVSGSDLTVWDDLLVKGSSLLIVGSVLWMPPALIWCYRQWKRAKQEQDRGDNDDEEESLVSRRRRRRRMMLLKGSISALVAGILWYSPHRSTTFGDDWLGVRKWSLWKSWLRFVSFEVLLDHHAANDGNGKNDMTRRCPRSSIAQDRNVLAFCPHGIFPFALGLGVLPELAQQAFGVFRPVVATAVKFFPIVGDFVAWLGAVDASRDSVARVMASNDRIGLVPGGIDEIFQGFPKPGSHPDEECAIVRKGFLKMAIQHGRPVVPIYCFGSTKMFRRLEIMPGGILEYLSHLWRISLVLFYGIGGLPIPFRQRLLYVVGRPIVPPSPASGNNLNQQVDQMHHQFCHALQDLFDRHKTAYGWGQKTLKIISK